MYRILNLACLEKWYFYLIGKAVYFIPKLLFLAHIAFAFGFALREQTDELTIYSLGMKTTMPQMSRRPSEGTIQNPKIKPS